MIYGKELINTISNDLGISYRIPHTISNGSMINEPKVVSTIFGNVVKNISQIRKAINTEIIFHSSYTTKYKE